LETASRPIHLLRIDASPRASKSNSIALTDAFVTAYTDALPSVTVDVMNVWDEKLPEFDNAAIDAKYKGVAGSAMNEAETAVWNRIQTLVARFKQADRIVLGVPMWNFAYPYKLKQLIDLVSQRNMLFTYDGERFGPLLQTPRAMVIYTRGQEYKEVLPTPPSRFDHQSGYVEFWLSFIGVQEVRALAVENTWGDQAEASYASGAREGGSSRLRFLTRQPRIDAFQLHPLVVVHLTYHCSAGCTIRRA
jgi:FMN-dependent NADH-azoreductase